MHSTTTAVTGQQEGATVIVHCYQSCLLFRQQVVCVCVCEL